MIILSGLLVIGAIALLVAGIVVQDEAVLGLHGLQLMYISIAVSIVSFLCLAIGVFLRRKELFGTAPTRAAAPKSRQPGRAARKAAARVVEDERPVEREEATPFAFPMPSGQVPDDAIVHVVPGRKRYHLDSCRQLAGRPTEELTYVEAQEEGFSPCTACLPDTALAARAIAGPADEAASGPDEQVETVHDAVRPERQHADAGRGDFTAAPYPPEPPFGTVGGDRYERTDGPGYEPAAYETPAYDTPAYESQGYESTGFDKPGFDKPGYDKQGYDKPGFETSAYETPTYERAEPVDRWQTPADPAPAPLPAPSPVEDTVTDWVPTAFPPSPLDKDYPLGDAPVEAEAAESGEWKRVVEPVAAEPVARTEAVRVLDDEPEEPVKQPVVPAQAEEAVVEPVAVSVPESRESEDVPQDAADDGDGKAERQAAGPLVRILSGTKRYHRPDCALIEDIGEDDEDLESLPRGEAKDRGCTPCLVCQPDKEPAV
ncbi:hypothetical protein [Actinocorallia sp. A-T 12471]|uniref:hypothetical protein n=1 Tax=Actinocorallia sp. A-T 12471 TaxID=3089813 RepID=UPI0029CC1B82|nr:hypothetical protein [Actinocorallia sp. A-T 12471]MDX6743063.1 hypothetical protein [Actinocorallia sp. A-T 12471]